MKRISTYPHEKSVSQGFKPNTLPAPKFMSSSVSNSTLPFSSTTSYDGHPDPFVSVNRTSITEPSFAANEKVLVPSSSGNPSKFASVANSLFVSELIIVPSTYTSTVDPPQSSYASALNRLMVHVPQVPSTTGMSKGNTSAKECTTPL